jgi:hypothetical protein
VSELLADHLFVGRLAVLAVAAILVLGASGAIVLMTRYEPKSRERAIGAAVAGLLTLVAPFLQMLLYIRLARVRIPTEDPFFHWLLLGEMGVIILLVFGRAIWLDTSRAAKLRNSR